MAFCQGDARSTPFPPERFDVVLLMANSFGYLTHADDDRAILTEAARLLRPGGSLLLDLTDYDYTRRHFLPASWHEANDDVVVCWRRELVGDVIRVRELVMSKTKGLLRDRGFSERFYPPDRLCTLLHEAGFMSPKVQPDAFIFRSEDGTDYGLATHRMAVSVVKR